MPRYTWMQVVEIIRKQIDFFSNLNKLKANGIIVFQVIEKRLFSCCQKKRFNIGDIVQNPFKD